MNHQQALDTHAPERYLLDEMTELERHAFENHYFSCADCADDVRLGGLLREGVSAGLAGPDLRSLTRRYEAPGLHRPAWRASVVLPWAAAAGLALVAGYQTLYVVPAMRHQIGPQALAPVTLRPASRGAELAVRRPANGVVTFALDVNIVDPAPTLAYDLRTAAGRSVASGVVAAPPPGAPLLLLVPVSVLGSTGGYLLSIRADGNGSPVEEYRFVVTEP